KRWSNTARRRGSSWTSMSPTQYSRVFFRRVSRRTSQLRALRRMRISARSLLIASLLTGRTGNLSARDRIGSCISSPLCKTPAGANVQRCIGGLTEDSADVPGPFGNYLLATTHTMQRSTSSGTGPIIDTQDWVFAAATGERLEMHIKYEKGVANKGNPAETKFYSAKNPSFYQISRQEQVLDILRNATTNPPDRVKEFSFKAGGGSYSKLFDGTEKLLSWDNILWINRSISVP